MLAGACLRLLGFDRLVERGFADLHARGAVSPAIEPREVAGLGGGQKGFDLAGSQPHSYDLPIN